MQKWHREAKAECFVAFTISQLTLWAVRLHTVGKIRRHCKCPMGDATGPRGPSWNNVRASIQSSVEECSCWFYSLGQSHADSLAFLWQKGKKETSGTQMADSGGRMQTVADRKFPGICVGHKEPSLQWPPGAFFLYLSNIKIISITVHCFSIF